MYYETCIGTAQKNPAGTDEIPARIVITDGGETANFDDFDYELAKYRFFASMSNEIQFEYIEQPGVLLLSDWGLRKVDLADRIFDPFNDEGVQRVFGQHNIEKLCQALRSTTPEHPVVEGEGEIIFDGEKRWCRCTARAIWSTDGAHTYLGSIGKVVDIHERHSYMLELQREANHDGLTGLVRHNYGKTLVGDRMRQHPDHLFMLMVVDLDYFKQANDTYGHQFGDKVLCHVADRLRESVRGGDVVSRVGGDEFVVCLECKQPQPQLVPRIFNHVIGECDGFTISLSVGAACAYGDDLTYDELFAYADEALYERKRAGRGGYTFSKTMGPRAKAS